MDRGYFNLTTLLIFFISILITTFISLNTAYKVDIVESKLRDKKILNTAYCEAHALLRNKEFLNSFYSDFSKWSRSQLKRIAYKKKFSFNSLLNNKTIDCLVHYDKRRARDRINISFNLAYLGQRKYVSIDCKLPKKVLLKERPFIGKSDLKNLEEKKLLEELLNSLSPEDSYLIEKSEGIYEGVYISDNLILDKDFYLDGILIVKGEDVEIDETKEINVNGLIITKEDLREKFKKINIKYDFKNIIDSSCKLIKLMELEIDNIKVYGGRIIA